MSDWMCSGCGESLDLAGEIPGAVRRPCPQCGSLSRTANVSLTATASVRAYLKVHSKHRNGGTKVVREVIAGDDYFRKTGTWSIMRRVIDRMNNWYEETFLDRDSGSLMHHKAEPLTEHRHVPKQE